MKDLSPEVDFVVVGASIAGLRAAIELAEAGRVLVVCKGDLPDFKRADPKGEAEWLGDEDEVSLHLQDTLDAGDGLCNAQALKTLIEEGAERIDELIVWGKHPARRLTFDLENAHTRVRVLHSQGGSTAKQVLRILLDKAQPLKSVSILPRTFATDLRINRQKVAGISLIEDQGVTHELTCSAVLLASGGLGQIYRNTTNVISATGDGLAMAFRAGAELSDLEFIQFYPTALHMKKVPRFLLAESLLEEGAYLRNIELDRFMDKYHPLAERASQDLVSRAIVHEMEVSRAKDPFVYLDLTHLNGPRLQKHFPRIHDVCMAYNLDITEDLLPVRPAAHYSVGGVRTDLDGRTSVPGLYAAGEVASTGVHGANRMPGNSLLESLVYGARAGKAMRNTEKISSRPSDEPRAAYSNGPVEVGIEELVGQIQDLMWNEVGIVRMRSGMQKALSVLEEIAPKLSWPKTRRGYEAANLHLAAKVVTQSALAREESRGAHYRLDSPDHDTKRFSKHSVLRGDKVLFVS